MKKIISAVVVALLVVTASITVIINVKDRKEESSKLYSLSEQYLALSVEKDALVEARNEYIDKRDAETRRGNYLVLFFDSVSDNLIKKAYPLLSEYNYKGTIVLCEGLIPGEEGNISREDFDFLLSHGWGTAIGYNSDIDMSAKDAPELLEEYLDNYIGRLTQAEIEVPITYCFKAGEYNSRFEPALKERGFKVIRHYGEKGNDIFGSAYIEDELYYIGAGVCCAASKNLQENVDIAYDEDLAYSMSVRYISDVDIDTRQDCTTDKYQRMLNYLETYSSGVVVCTASELYGYKQAQFVSAEGTIGKYNEEIAKYDREIAELDAKLAEIIEELE